MIVPERIMKSGKVCPAFQIDDDLAPMLMKRKWCPDEEGYIKTSRFIGGKTRYFSLHRLVFRIRNGRWPKYEIDHINRDKLDNRSANLREATNQQNIDNGGGRPRLDVNNHLPKGVYFHPKNCKSRPFMVYLTVSGRLKFLGHFATVEQASLAVKQFKERSAQCSS
jgi:hypothetical protein